MRTACRLLGRSRTTHYRHARGPVLGPKQRRQPGPQALDDLRFIGGVFVYPLAGCGKPQCQPAWIGTSLASSAASPPVVVDDVILVGKGPASGFPVDSGFFTYNLRGCGAVLCPPISLVQLGELQFYNGGPPAVTDHKIFMASTDNTDGHSNVYTATLS